MCLTDEERALLTEQLKEAQAAYHALLLGRQARVVVDQNGERVEFTAGNKNALAAYIVSLKAQLGLLNPECGAVGMPGRPASFIF